MLNQTFNPRKLKRLVTDKEIKQFNLGLTDDEVLKSITNISYMVSQSSFEFNTLIKTTFKGKDVFHTGSKEEYFAIKKLNSVLKRIYLSSLSSRDDILSELVQILSDGSHYKVIRADIKEFYENVPRRKVVRKLKEDSLLGSLMINKLNQLERKLSDLSCSNLPRGISISTTMSELYLRTFDSVMRAEKNVYYYARYVDDIIIVCIDNVEDVEKKLRNELEELELELNDKFQITDVRRSGDTFNYLGLSFEFYNDKTKVSLPELKVNKLKTKLIKAILDYKKKPNCDLLQDRIKFLTGNYRLYSKKHSNNLKGGIYFSNQHINNYSQFNELNLFLRKSLTAKRGSLAKVTKLIPQKTVTLCLRECFFKGFIEKRVQNFTSSMDEIMRCWKNA